MGLKRLFWAGALGGLLAAEASGALAPTYVDAVPGVGGNTVRVSDASPSSWYTVNGSDNDGLWALRNFGRDGTLFEAAAAEDAPMVRTRISGLIPGEKYRVWVNYWSEASTNDAILAARAGGVFQTFDRLGLAGATPGSQAGLNLDLGTSNQLNDALGGPAYSAFGGLAALADVHDLWNGIGRTDVAAGTLVYCDGRLATQVSIDTGRESGLGSGVIDWSREDLVTRVGSIAEGIQSDGAGGWASAVLRAYVRENAVDESIRAAGFAVGGLSPGSYAVYVVADNTYNTTTVGTNRAYHIYAGTGETNSGFSSFSGLARKTITNTSWDTWQAGVNYVGFELSVAADQEIIVVSKETSGLQDHSLINCIQIMPLGQGGRVELMADLGEAVPDAAGFVDVYIEDSLGGQRCYYDGVTYLHVPQEPPAAWTVLSDNGGWCWFQDERVLIDGDRLIVGSVANSGGTGGATLAGNIEVITYDMVAGEPPIISVLHANLQNDDHNAPALLRLPDGHYLAAYSKHSSDSYIRFSISAAPGDSTWWVPEFTVFREGATGAAGGHGVCYNNLMRLSAENGGNGRIYNFYRGEGYDPNFIISDDNGRTWRTGGRLLYNTLNDSGTRPYAKYASNDVDTIHFVSTEAHPNGAVYTSIYHGYIRDMIAYHSDGTIIGDLRSGPIEATTPTRIYAGSIENGNAWTTEIHLDSADRPYIGYSIHFTDSDHRYRYARWDGSQWHDHEMAYAGTRLRIGPAENGYTGLIALDPQNPNRVFISTNSHPVTNQPLISATDGQRHWEIFRGTTGDFGATWTWTAVTENSTADNVRPVVPIATGSYSALVWLRGSYITFTDYDLDVVAMMFLSADLDTDRDVDSADLDVFMTCQTGPGVVYAPGQLYCPLELNRAGLLPVDLDGDFDVDQVDFGMFQRCFSGPDNPPDLSCVK